MSVARFRRFRNPCVVLNPQAASGKAGKSWGLLHPLLRGSIGDVEVLRTAAPGHATELTRRALADGAGIVIAVGGDGTLNEVVNGYFRGGAPVSDASLALVPVGTGGDFRRSAGIPSSLAGAVRAINDSSRRRIDVGWVRLTDREGRVVDRYFLNQASFGLGGEVSIAAKSNFLTAYSGKGAFLWATASAFLRFRAKTVQLELDGGPLPEPVAVMQVSLGNGSYHGGGMRPCPLAKLSSGCLEVTVIEEASFWEFLRALPPLYSGRVYTVPKCRHYRAKRIAARSDEAVWAEVDGEAIGGLPLEAGVLPSAIPFVGADGNA